jgi:hypothetical protein
MDFLVRTCAQVACALAKCQAAFLIGFAPYRREI